MKQPKKKPTARTIEYRLLLSTKYNEREKKYKTMLELQTVQEFISFRYEIVVQDIVKENVLRLSILGLHAPQPMMPAAGVAVFRKEYPELNKVKEIVVKKIDGAENSFSVDITRKGIVVKKSPKEKFVELIVK